MTESELSRRLQACDNGVSDAVMEDVYQRMCEAINSPRSLACWLLFSSGEHDQLVSLSTDPLHYLRSYAFADDYLVTSFLSKYPFLKLSTDPEEVALKKFIACEEQCKATNIRFKDLDLDPSEWDPVMSAIFRSARRKVKNVIGEVNLSKIASYFGWGPGATSVSTGTRTTAYDKFSQRLDVTSNALVMGWCCVNSSPSWVNCQLQTDEFPSVDIMLTRESFNLVRGNEIVFVPKNAKTHRVIAIEPHVNSFLQKGIGGYLRQRLKHRANVDLNDQSINQRLACEGSLTGKLATIDLSGASDTISTELVRYLLPDQWFTLLDQVRSKQGRVQKTGSWMYYNKFSSMGNGYTFELESLIFWALCRATVDYFSDGVDEVVSVYGDDLIIPTHSYDNVAKVLTFAGFTFNDQKSFSSGPFRESCGKDFFNGIDVRPIFQKERVSHVEAIYKLANGIRRYSHRRNFGYGCDIRFLPLWSCLSDRLHPTFRNLRIPEGYGDGGLVVNFDEACPKRPSAGLRGNSNTAGWDGWFYKTLSRRPLKKAMRDRNATYVTALFAAGSPEPLLGFKTPRGRTYPTIARGHTWVWYDFGAWW